MTQNDFALALAAGLDEYREPCPKGCLGKTTLGVRGDQVPAYCGAHGCDVESPGMAYRPDDAREG